MKIVYQISDNMKIELEGADQKDVFEKLSDLSEVFGENECGACKSPDVRFMVRTVDKNKFYELKCNQCGARLSFGAHKTGDTLFPKRKDAEGNWYDNKGWTKWDGTKRA
jgi:hypothetical protein